MATPRLRVVTSRHRNSWTSRNATTCTSAKRIRTWPSGARSVERHGTVGTIRAFHRHLNLPNDPVEAENEAHRLPDAAVQRRTASIPTDENEIPKSETFRLGEATECT